MVITQGFDKCLFLACLGCFLMIIFYYFSEGCFWYFCPCLCCCSIEGEKYHKQYFSQRKVIKKEDKKSDYLSFLVAT